MVPQVEVDPNHAPFVVPDANTKTEIPDNPAFAPTASNAICPLSFKKKFGASTVFPENVAAGLALADQVLLVCGFSQDNAANIVTTVRAELNPELRGRVGI